MKSNYNALWACISFRPMLFFHAGIARVRKDMVGPNFFLLSVRSFAYWPTEFWPFICSLFRSNYCHSENHRQWRVEHNFLNLVDTSFAELERNDSAVLLSMLESPTRQIPCRPKIMAMWLKLIGSNFNNLHDPGHLSALFYREVCLLTTFFSPTSRVIQENPLMSMLEGKRNQSFERWSNKGNVKMSS